jgi:hypothetical protein
VRGVGCVMWGVGMGWEWMWGWVGGRWGGDGGACVVVCVIECVIVCGAWGERRAVCDVGCGSGVGGWG